MISQLNPHTRDVIFFWIPKSAGNSISAVLQEKINMQILTREDKYKQFLLQGGPVTFGHVSISELLDSCCLSYTFYNRALRFAFVRNPWDRLVSLYHYLQKHEIIPQDYAFSDFCCQTCQEPIEPVGLYNRKGLSQANPQVDWLLHQNKIMPDFIGRYENLQADFNTVCALIEIDCFDLPVTNTTQHEHYTEYYDDKTCDMVALKYAFDIHLFNYQFGK